MALSSLITVNIPDIDVVVRDDEDLRRWVTTSLSEMIIKRLKALKESSDQIKAMSARSVVLDELGIETRGIGITMGGMSS